VKPGVLQEPQISVIAKTDKLPSLATYYQTVLIGLLRFGIFIKVSIAVIGYYRFCQLNFMGIIKSYSKKQCHSHLFNNQ